ncbi:MAG: patatin-like phospholipase family protein [Acidobacteriota bacterium]|nr:patatin-like phospholipase family protein [Acidobacteriota bacterium]
MRAPVLLFLFAATLVAMAQPSVPARPPVGVALNGGGALGLAHVGVLLYFEEHHIPVGAVAGTSMGGLVGGLYASGMDARELRTMAITVDWEQFLSPTPRYRNQPIVEKQSWRRASGDFTLRFGRKLSLPAGLNTGEAMMMLLSRNLNGYGSAIDFDQLPIPFRCVATNLTDGGAEIMHDGSLSEAMRATMSIPAVFTPVRRNGKVLVDGGLMMNLPVEALQQMPHGASIAVQLDSGKPSESAYNTLTGIASRSVAVVILQNEKRSAALADLVIDVNVSRFSSTDYTQARALIDAGYQAASAMSAQLAPFQVDDAQWASYLAARNARRLPAHNRGAVVQVRAERKSFEDNARQEISRKTGNAAVSDARLEEVLNNISNATNTPVLSYWWDNIKDGYGVKFQRRSGESVLLKPAFQYSIGGQEPAQYAIRLTWSGTPDNAYESRWLMTQVIGNDPGMRGEYFDPHGGRGIFIAPGVFISRKNFYQYANGDYTSAHRDRYGASFYVGAGTWQYAQVRLGARAGFDSYQQPFAVDGVSARDNGFADPELTWTINTQDAPSMASRGLRWEGAMGYSWRKASYPYLKHSFDWAIPATPSITLNLGSHAESSLGRKLNYYEQARLGGLESLAAYKYQQFAANSYVSTSGGVTLHPAFTRQMSLYPGLALWYEAARMDLGSAGWRTAQSATTAIFFHTPFGIAGLGVAFNEEGKARLRFTLGAVESK